MKRLLILFTMLFMFCVSYSQNQDPTKTLNNIQPTGYVNDFQNLLTPAQKDTLEKMMSDYEKKTSIEFTLVTFFIEPMDYNQQDIVDLAQRWGVGKKGLDNGFMMFLSYSTEKGKSNYLNLTGYELEPFLPDGKLSYMESQIYPNTLYVGNIYEAYKNYIIACQKVLGDDDYEMLVESKRLRDIARAEAAKKALHIFLYVLFTTLIVLFIVFLVKRYIKKRQEYFNLKTDIENLNKKITDLKSKIGTLPDEYQKIYDSRKISLSKKDITYDTRSDLTYIYNQLLDYKSTINSINTSISDISSTKNTLTKYLRDIPHFYDFCKDYPKCNDYIENNLNEILSSFNLEQLTKSTEYTKNRMYSLTGIKQTIDKKLEAFTNKMVKVKKVIVDYENFHKIEDKLKDDYNEFTRKRNILLGSHIGNRTINDFDINQKISSLKSYITKSFDELKVGNIDNSLFNYGEYVVTNTVIDNNMSKVTTLFKKYNESVSFLQDNSDFVENKLSKIKHKITNSGVSSYRKTKFSNIKGDIKKYEDAKDVDIILAASLLATLISEMNTLYSNIKSDISSYNYSSSYSSSSSSSYSSSSSSGGFGGFGGGGFGGGGSGGSF